jgi:hypothetical protein
MSGILTIGSKAQVWHGTAKHTSGGLTKKDLMRHKGRIISRRKHAIGKKAIKHLFALGFKPTKGRFSLMRKSMAHSGSQRRGSRRGSRGSRRRTRRRGGAAGVMGSGGNGSGSAQGGSGGAGIGGMMKMLGQ